MLMNGRTFHSKMTKDPQVGLSLLCSKIFRLFFLALHFFLTYYSQNYAHNFYDSCMLTIYTLCIDFTAYNVVLKL